VTWSALGLRQPVVAATSRQTSPYPFQGGIFGQMAEYEFVAALGRKLGLATLDGTEFFSVGVASKQPVDDLTAWYEEYLSNELKTGAPGITLDELKALPGAVWIDLKKPTAYQKYAAPLASKLVVDPDGTVWDKPATDPKRTQQAIVVNGLLYDKVATEGGIQIGRIIAGGAFFTDGDKLLDGPKLVGKTPKQIGYAIAGTDPRRGFFTSSGKVEFFNAKFSQKNDANGRAVDPGPSFSPRDWQPSADYPLYLINWKEASHTHTRSQNNPLLITLKSTNPLVIHTDTAAKLGIADGDGVIVESPNGSVRAVAEVSLRIHPEVVGAQHGFGHIALGRVAKGRGTAFGDLNTIRYDPLSGQASHKEICVRVRKA
jgi:anaerobic selenocysteine-containing dehydrogenase